MKHFFGGNIQEYFMCQNLQNKIIINIVGSP